jgi:hypothetical protein
MVPFSLEKKKIKALFQNPLELLVCVWVVFFFFSFELVTYWQDQNVYAGTSYHTMPRGATFDGPAWDESFWH